MNKEGKANVSPMRQTTQYNCMAVSMVMALRSLNIDSGHATIDKVNQLMNVKPLQGATWEDAIACASHFGIRTALVTPCTLEQIKTWTDQGFPVLIGWNPENRPWSHASVIFDVSDNMDVIYIADPNIPDPDETVRIISKHDFYSKWFEKSPVGFIIRRPALVLMPEINSDGIPINKIMLY